MTIQSPQQLSDRDLLDATARAAGAERHSTVELLRLLAELDARRLYLSEGCSSLFAYCTQVLHLSEHAAYHRIEAARAATQFPVVLDLLAEGALTLTTVALLRSQLTSENYGRLLDAARHKTKREVEHQIACLAPQPDQKTLVRRVAAPALIEAPVPAADERPAPPPLMHVRPVVIPLAETRYLIKVTVSAKTHANLRRAQDLLRHTVPNGDPAAILDRALTILVEHLERAKVAKTERPRPGTSVQSNSRRVPAAVRRAVWKRDQGRCAFEGPQGRCRETGHLEFHHIIPFTDGGPAETANISLRCRAHNGFEYSQWSGCLETRPATRSGPS